MRRMIGAAVLLIAALVLVALLPDRVAPDGVASDPAAADSASRIKVLTLDETPEMAAAVIDPAHQADVSDPTAAEQAAEGAAPDFGPGDAENPSTASVSPESAPESVPESVPESAPESAPQTAQIPEPVAAAVKAPTPAPAPSTRPKPAPRVHAAVDKTQPAAPPSTPAVSADGPWWVQIGSFSKVETARSVQDKLAARGLKSVVAPVPVKDTTLYRVRSGPFADRLAAESAQKSAAAAGYPQTQVLSH